MPVGNTGMGVVIQPNRNAMANINTNPSATKISVTGEDQNYNVPIGFDFPFQGKTFNNSWMNENGVVTFQDPGKYSFCCNALPINSVNREPFSYSIFPFWTDLTTRNGGSLFTLGNENSRTYGWYNMSEYATKPANKMSIELTINKDGTFRSAMNNVLVTNHFTSSGFVGDATKKEERFQSFFYGVEGVNPAKTQSWSYGPLPPPDLTNSEDERRKYALDYIFEMRDQFANRKSFGFSVNRYLEELEQEREERARQEVISRRSRATDINNRFGIRRVEPANTEDEDRLKQMIGNNVIFNDVYSKTALTEIPFYRDQGVYRNQRVIDNARAMRALQNDGKMKQMIESQWDLEGKYE